MNAKLKLSEYEIRESLAEVTGQNTAGIAASDDFCEVLGLDSLDRLELLSMVEDRLDILLSDRQISTIRSLEDLCAAVNGDGCPEAAGARS